MKTEITCLIFGLLYAMYAIFGDKPFLFNNFWKSYIWTITFGFSMTLLLFNLNQATSTFYLCIRWGIIILLALLIVFNLSLINATNETFKKFCTYKWLSLIYAGLVGLVTLVSFIIKCIK
jgi:hypothetical protein